MGLVLQGAEVRQRRDEDWPWGEADEDEFEAYIAALPERWEGKVAGIAVIIGARVAAHAGAGDVLVSGTVKDLVAGSGLEFEDRGMTALEGVPGEWRLFAAVV